MPTDSERLKILELINSGQVSVEQGLKLIEALDGAGKTGAPVDGEVVSQTSPQPLDPSAPASLPAPPALEEPPIPPPSGDPEPVVVSSFPEVVGRSQSYSSPGDGAQAEGSEEYVRPQETVLPSEVERWKRWWKLPLYIGVGVTVIGALLMFLAWRAWEFSFWFACAWVPFLFGIGVIAFSLASSRMRWLHLRVTQSEGQTPRRIAISMPLPVRLIASIVRAVGARAPGMRERRIDEMILALETLDPDQPLHMEVDNDGGAHVEIFIG